MDKMEGRFRQWEFTETKGVMLVDGIIAQSYLELRGARFVSSLDQGTSKHLVCHSLSETKLLISGEFQDDKPKSVRNKVVQK